MSIRTQQQAFNAARAVSKAQPGTYFVVYTPADTYHAAEWDIANDEDYFDFHHGVGAVATFEAGRRTS